MPRKLRVEYEGGESDDQKGELLRKAVSALCLARIVLQSRLCDEF